jgi:hypothetical protein
MAPQFKEMRDKNGQDLKVWLVKLNRRDLYDALSKM